MSFHFLFDTCLVHIWCILKAIAFRVLSERYQNRIRYNSYPRSFPSLCDRILFCTACNYHLKSDRNPSGTFQACNGYNCILIPGRTQSDIFPHCTDCNRPPLSIRIPSDTCRPYRRCNSQVRSSRFQSGTSLVDIDCNLLNSPFLIQIESFRCHRAYNWQMKSHRSRSDTFQVHKGYSMYCLLQFGMFLIYTDRNLLICHFLSEIFLDHKGYNLTKISDPFLSEMSRGHIAYSLPTNRILLWSDKCLMSKRYIQLM
jgi:hypothetical protein